MGNYGVRYSYGVLDYDGFPIIRRLRMSRFSLEPFI